MERVVSKKSKKGKKEEKNPSAQPWISMGRGVKIIAFTSIAMAVLTAWQVIPSKGWLEGILWGLLFGVLIWVIFFGNIMLNRFLRR
jgi:uncharacterized membrane protein